LVPFLPISVNSAIVPSIHTVQWWQQCKIMIIIAVPNKFQLISFQRAVSFFYKKNLLTSLPSNTPPSTYLLTRSVKIHAGLLRLNGITRHEGWRELELPTRAKAKHYLCLAVLPEYPHLH
jgi:hypothetical protein